MGRDLIFFFLEDIVCSKDSESFAWTLRKVFISFRVKEARAQALAMKEAIHRAGYTAFCSEDEGDLPPGSDCETVIPIFPTLFLEITFLQGLKQSLMHSTLPRCLLS